MRGGDWAIFNNWHFLLRNKFEVNYFRISELEHELNEKELKLKEIKANMKRKDRGLWALREKESLSGYSRENNSDSYDNSFRRKSR
jgi:hypothetical protein